MDSGLTDIALRGLEAARLLVDRFVDAIDGAAPMGASPLAGDADDDGPPRTPGAGPLGEVWADVLRTTANAWSGTASTDGGSTPSELRVGVPGGIVLPLSIAAPGHVGVVELWLHNRTGSPIDHVRIVPAALRSSSGAEIPEDAVEVDPLELGSVPARSSRGIVLSVRVPADAPEGRYRAVVLVDGLPDVWALLDVRVGDA